VKTRPSDVAAARASETDGVAAGTKEQTVGRLGISSAAAAPGAAPITIDDTAFGTLNLDTGDVTPIVTGMTSARGLLFVKATHYSSD
jgi:hypothetical protein